MSTKIFAQVPKNANYFKFELKFLKFLVTFDDNFRFFESKILEIFCSLKVSRSVILPLLPE